MSQTIPGTSPTRVGKLDTARDVRKELARLYRSGRRGDLPASDCSRLASVLGLVLKSLEVHELEERVTRLENEQ
jgi:hypothetical protein